MQKSREQQHTIDFIVIMLRINTYFLFLADKKKFIEIKLNENKKIKVKEALSINDRIIWNMKSRKTISCSKKLCLYFSNNNKI